MSSATATPTGTFTLSPEQVTAYHRDGYLIVRNLWYESEVATLEAAAMEVGPLPTIKGLHDRTTNTSDPLHRYPRLMHPHRHADLGLGRRAHAGLLDARIGACLHALLGEPALAAQSMFYFKPPGARGQALHQDQYYLRVQPDTCIAAWTAIDPADPGNGGMSVVPGSHRLGVLQPRSADSSLSFTEVEVDVPDGMHLVPAIMQRGDVLFFNGQVIHGSTPNRSVDRFRRAFICHYVPASSTAISPWYQPLLTFAGEARDLPAPATVPAAATTQAH